MQSPPPDLLAQANLIAAGMLLLALVTLVVTLWRQGRSDRRKAIKEGEAEVTAAAAQTAAIADLAAANTRIARSLESLDSWARGHEVADARYQATAATIQSQQAEALTRLVSMQENMQRQITNVALRLAPADAVDLAPNRPGRRGAR